jgi:hypothetical protein
MVRFDARLLACTVCVVAASVTGSDGRMLPGTEEPATIRDHVRRHGAFERIVVDVDPPLSLAELAGRADLVIEASAEGAETFVNEAGTRIYSDYAFTVRGVIKNRRSPGLRPGSALTVRRESGSVRVEDRPATVFENAFPAFVPGASYFLFLAREQDRVYSVIGGVHGVYEAGDYAVPLVAVPLPEGGRGRVSSAAFVGEVRALLRFAN